MTKDPCPHCRGQGRTTLTGAIWNTCEPCKGTGVAADDKAPAMSPFGVAMMAMMHRAAHARGLKIT